MTPLRLTSNKSKIYGETNVSMHQNQKSARMRVKRSDMTVNVEQNNTSDKKIPQKKVRNFGYCKYS